MESECHDENDGLMHNLETIESEDFENTSLFDSQEYAKNADDDDSSEESKEKSDDKKGKSKKKRKNL